MPASRGGLSSIIVVQPLTGAVNCWFTSTLSGQFAGSDPKLDTQSSATYVTQSGIVRRAIKFATRSQKRLLSPRKPHLVVPYVVLAYFGPRSLSGIAYLPRLTLRLAGLVCELRRTACNRVGGLHQAFCAVLGESMPFLLVLCHFQRPS